METNMRTKGSNAIVGVTTFYAAALNESETERAAVTVALRNMATEAEKFQMAGRKMREGAAAAAMLAVELRKAIEKGLDQADAIARLETIEKRLSEVVGC